LQKETEMDKKATAVLRELEEYKKSHPNMWNVPPDAGMFLMILAKSMRAKNILEVGMSNGYSTIYLALAARETSGRVTSIEGDPERMEMARENFARAGVSELIDIRAGKALEVIPGIEGPLDYVFLDATKGEYIDYFNAVWEKVRPGGVIVADNVVNLASSLRDYIEMTEKHEGLDTVLIPVGNGEMLSYKRLG